MSEPRTGASSLLQVTDRDRARWSVHAARALAEILEEAYLLHLPPLIWQVTGLGLAGTVPPGEPETVLQDWRRWVAHTRLVVGEATSTGDGQVLHLRASATYVTRRTPVRHRVQVTIRAAVDSQIQVPAPPAA